MSITVLAYKNFREFLKDSIEQKRSSDPKLSYRALSKKMGFSSPNFILLVIQGKRNLSVKSIDSVCKYLALGRTEKDYFRHLVLMNQAETFEEKLEHSKKLLSAKVVSEKKHITPELLSYYSSWINIVVREMTLLTNFSSDMDWMFEKLNGEVSKKDIEAAIATLLKLELIKKKGDGKYLATDKDVRAPSEVRSEFIRAFHLEMMLKASKSLTEYGPELRDITSVTLPISISMLPEIKKRIEDFRHSISEAVKHHEEHDEVYQLNVQLFPLTKVKS